MNQAAGWPGTSTNGPVGALYESNALVYHSPSFYGATVELEYAPGGVPGHFQGGTRESVVLRYSNYGLNLAAVYYNGHDTNPFPATFPNAPANPATGLNNNRFYCPVPLIREQSLCSFSRMESAEAVQANGLQFSL